MRVAALCRSGLLACSLTGAAVMGLMAPTMAVAQVDFAEIVQTASPSVVNINATSTRTARGSGIPDEYQEFLRRFYGLEIPPQGPQTRQSFGSGFIISADGFILTNNHVIDETDKIIVRLNDRRELEARVIGRDPRTDIALLKIEATGLNAVTIGSPDTLRVGEAVLAIGSPFGFDYSATAGIVSAKARSLPSDSYVPFIQTDVPINPGNSGGPLFNARGEVVGINSQIYSRSGGFMGVSFAIPIDVAMEVVSQLRANGRVSRGFLGVAIQEVTRDLADAYGLARPAGALIASVEPGSPAAAAGLQAGDVVTRFHRTDILRASDLPQSVGRATVGMTYDLALVRERRAMTVRVTLQAAPDEAAPATTPATGKTPSPKAGADLARLGMVFRDLTDRERSSGKGGAAVSGVVVVRVVAPSVAEAGFRAGDLVVRLGSTAITSVAQLTEQAARLSATANVPVTVMRGGAATILPLRLQPTPAAPATPAR